MRTENIVDAASSPDDGQQASSAVLSPHAPGEHHTPVHYHGGSGRRALLFAAALSIVLGVAFVLGLRLRNQEHAALVANVQEQASQPPLVEVAHAVPASAETEIKLPGEAAPLYETTLFARTNGYVSKWLVDIGDKVKARQLLATIETPELDDQLAESKARVAALEAELNLADANVNFAQVTFKRFDDDGPQGVVSKQDRDQKKTELETSLAKREVARAQLTLGKAEMHRLASLSEFKKVVAPFDGVITRRYVDVGALITAGSTSNTTPLFRISRSDQIRALVDVPQSVSSQITVGMKAVATCREHPGRQFLGKVDRTTESIDPVSRTLRVEVLIPNQDYLLRPGAYLQVEFKSRRPAPPLRIPASALNLRTGGPEVAVVDAGGKVTFHKVRIASDLGDCVEVESGLEPGARVALNISHEVMEGDRVNAHDLDATVAISHATASPTQVHSQ